MADRLEGMDAVVDQWAFGTKQSLMETLSRMGIQDKIKMAKTVTRLKLKRKQVGGDKLVEDPFLYGSLRYKLVRKQMELEAVGFSFARHGIFIEHGVGKNRRVGSAAAGRARKPWLSQVLPLSVETLADILVEEYADIAATALVMRIPGVLETSLNLQGGKVKVVENVTAQQRYLEGVLNDFVSALNEDEREMTKRWIRSKMILKKIK